MGAYPSVHDPFVDHWWEFEKQDEYPAPGWSWRARTAASGLRSPSSRCSRWPMASRPAGGWRSAAAGRATYGGRSFPHIILYQRQIVKGGCLDICLRNWSDYASHVSDHRRPWRSITQHLGRTQRLNLVLDEQEPFGLDEIEQLVQPLDQECLQVC